MLVGCFPHGTATHSRGVFSRIAGRAGCCAVVKFRFDPPRTYDATNMGIPIAAWPFVCVHQWVEPPAAPTVVGGGAGAAPDCVRMLFV